MTPKGRTNVYLFESTDLFAEYSDRREIWARGYYRHARNEIILARRTVGQAMMEEALRTRLAGLTPEAIDLEPNPEALDVDETLQHELTHHFMDVAGADLGAWANEGLAEVVGRARMVGGRLVLGAPQRVSLANLQAAERDGVTLRLPHLLELSDDEFYKGASPYPESWAFVEFLRGKAGGAEDLRGFLKTLEQVNKRKDLDALEAEWRAWVRATPATDGIEAELTSSDVEVARAGLQALSLLLTMGAVPEADRARLGTLALAHPCAGALASLRELMQVLDREQITSPDLEAAADALLDQADGPLRAAAATCLQEEVKGSPQRLARFRALLVDPEARVRAAAIAGLLAAQQDVDRAHIAALARDPSPRVRALVMRSLDAWGTDDATFEAAMSDPEWEVQLCAAIALWRRGKAEGRERALRLAEDKETAPRLFAAAALQHCPPDGAAELWDRLSKDLHSTVRAMAQRRWAARGEAERREALLRGLTDGADEVRIASLELLGERRVPDLEVTLVGRLCDPSAWVRMRAARLAGEWKLEAARAALATLLEDDSSQVRHEAAVALAAMGDRSGVPVLIDELGADEWGDQRRGILALRKLAGQSFDFHWSAPEDRRAESIGRWRAWWRGR